MGKKLERKMPRSGLVKLVLETSQSDDIWKALDEYDLILEFDPNEGHCPCGKKVNHTVNFKNRHTAQVIAVGENCADFFRGGQFQLQVKDLIKRYKKAERLQEKGKTNEYWEEPDGTWFDLMADDFDNDITINRDGKVKVKTYSIPANFFRSADIEEMRANDIIKPSYYNDYDIEKDYALIDLLGRIGWRELSPSQAIQLQRCYDIFIEPFCLGKPLTDEQYEVLLKKWKERSDRKKRAIERAERLKADFEFKEKWRAEILIREREFARKQEERQRKKVLNYGAGFYRAYEEEWKATQKSSIVEDLLRYRDILTQEHEYLENLLSKCKSEFQRNSVRERLKLNSKYRNLVGTETSKHKQLKQSEEKRQRNLLEVETRRAEDRAVGYTLYIDYRGVNRGMEVDKEFIEKIRDMKVYCSMSVVFSIFNKDYNHRLSRPEGQKLYRQHIFGKRMSELEPKIKSELKELMRRKSLFIEVRYGKRLYM